MVLDTQLVLNNRSKNGTGLVTQYVQEFGPHSAGQDRTFGGHPGGCPANPCWGLEAGVPQSAPADTMTPAIDSTMLHWSLGISLSLEMLLEK